MLRITSNFSSYWLIRLFTSRFRQPQRIHPFQRIVNVGLRPDSTK
ncbi:hypothetical protein EXT73_20510 [Pectobacterium atrosepticum]|nr:hypothetical protein [Pectobacterium atrosepticum]PWD57852.1 hypothetical protein DF214_13910 [Pectobacterium atrosepticum]QXE14449.1 hypothetical protein DCX48_07985 [Pectobacterium atrosepticum]